MKQLKNQFLSLLWVSIVVMGVACNPDDEPRITPFDAQILVQFPEDFEESVATSAVVALRNLASGATQEGQAGQDGVVVFQGLVPGTYELSASLQLSAEEADAVAGIAMPINLNYLNNNLMLTEDATSGGPIPIRLAGSVSGGLIIKQVYYSGSKTPEGGNYFFDQFFEIHNNSDEPITLDGLILSNAHGPSGLISPNTAPTPFGDDQDHTYVTTAWRIPGSGEDHVLQPFTGVIIAQQGINHQAEEANPGSPVNLSNADFELFVVGSERDVDAPNVPNLEMLYHPFNSTFALVPVFGPGTIIWRTDDFEALEQVSIPDTSPEFPRVLKVPNDLVVDAVEALRSDTDGAFKRIPVSLDAGFAHVTDTYTGESIIRKSSTVDGNTVYQDTNNSSQDFEVLSTPLLP